MSIPNLRPPRIQVSERFNVVHMRVVAVAKQAKAVHIREYEGRAPDDIGENLSPVVLKLLEEAVAVLQEVSDFSKNGEEFPHLAEAPDLPSRRSFELAMDEFINNDDENRSLSAALQDISFIASLELNQWHKRLQTMTACDSGWMLLEEYDSALRRVVKSLNATENLLSNYLGIDALLDFTSELRISLEIRRCYARFRTFIRSSCAPSEENIKTRLRGVGTRIAMLVGKDIYADLRVGDRQHLFEMQTRLLDWLRGSSNFDFRVAQRLWQDIESCIRLFGQISARQELIEHDKSTVRFLWNRFQQSKGDFKPSEEDHKMLQSLYGVDDEISLFLFQEHKTSAEWKSCLEGLVARFALDDSASESVPTSDNCFI